MSETKQYLIIRDIIETAIEKEFAFNKHMFVFKDCIDISTAKDFDNAMQFRAMRIRITDDDILVFSQGWDNPSMRLSYCDSDFINKILVELQNKYTELFRNISEPLRFIKAQIILRNVPLDSIVKTFRIGVPPDFVKFSLKLQYNIEQCTKCGIWGRTNSGSCNCTYDEVRLIT